MAKKIRITLVGSPYARLLKQRRTLKALGLGRKDSSVIHDDTPPIRGMIQVVGHLVSVADMREKGTR